jgi:transposase-like protein
MGAPQYSEAFRAKIVKKLLVPGGVSQTKLAAEIGVPQGTLSRWLREARTVAPMSEKKAKSPRNWSAAEKLRVVVEAARLPDAELGEFLRREGVHEAQLREWRDAAAAGLDAAAKPRRASSEAKELKKLAKELRRKEKALAEVTALLVLKKKADELWGDEDDSTDEKSEK